MNTKSPAMEDVFRAFVEKWTHPSYRPDPVPESVLIQLEQNLKSRLPLSYKKFLQEFGPVSTTLSLLSSIVEQSLAIHNLSEFLAPGDVVEQTRAWQPLGLPADCISFGIDASGSMFCFSRATLSETELDDVGVLFFDHDEGTVTSISKCFVDWLRELAEIPNIENS